MQKLIQLSFEKMKELLFPFDFKRWLKILVIVWLAGVASSGGGGGNWGKNINSARNSSAVKTPVAAVPSQTNSAPAVSAGTAVTPAASDLVMPSLPRTDSAVNPALQKTDEKQKRKQEFAERFKKTWPWVLFGGIGIGLPLMILAMWINSRFQFILLHFLIRQDLGIRAAFKNYRELGNSLLAFDLAFIIFTLCGVGLSIVPMFLGPVGMGLGVLFLILFLLAVLLAVALMNDFVIPLMFRQNLKVRAAIKLFWDQDFDLGQIGMYYLVKVGLSIAAAIALGVVSVVVMLAIGIPTGVMIALTAWMMKTVAALKVLGAVVMVIAGAVAVLAIIAALGLIGLPVHIFFQCFRIYFVGKLLPDFALYAVSDSAERPVS